MNGAASLAKETQARTLPEGHLLHVRLPPKEQVDPRRLGVNRFVRRYGGRWMTGVPESAVSVTVKPVLQTFLWVSVTMSEMP